jgi:hypothetical protein
MLHDIQQPLAMSKSIEDSGEDSDDTEGSDIKRSNKWTGASSTWLSLTAQERGLIASLDQVRDEDLSIHLYNAYALKHRRRNFAQDLSVRSTLFSPLTMLKFCNRLPAYFSQKKTRHSFPQKAGLLGRYLQIRYLGMARPLDQATRTRYTHSNEENSRDQAEHWRLHWLASH